MERKKLIDILSELLTPIGFNRKGSYWVKNDTSLIKKINLQKSYHSNLYYINYGYILKSIPLDNLMMHVYNRVSSLDTNERNKIDFLLDLDSDIPDEERLRELRSILQINLIDKIQRINTEEDLSEELFKRPTLNDIPLIVKKYFNIN